MLIHESDYWDDEEQYTEQEYSDIINKLKEATKILAEIYESEKTTNNNNNNNVIPFPKR